MHFWFFFTSPFIIIIIIIIIIIMPPPQTRHLVGVLLLSSPGLDTESRASYRKMMPSQRGSVILTFTHLANQ
jgi:hypothetical protein